MTLYELTGQYIEVLEMLQDDAISEDVIKDTLEGLEGEIEAKAEGYAIIDKELEAEELKLVAEIERLTARKKSIASNRQRLTENLKASMEATGKTKFNSDHFKFSIVNNGGQLPLIIKDGAVVPMEYTHVEYSPDKKAIRKALDAGELIDFAYYGERGTHLSIK